jgi:uncharacterized membrane protein
MGTINKLPGISGGLYAIVIGFYSDLMLSIKKINKESLKDLLTFRLSLFSDKINGRFLLFLSIGMIVSYFTTSRLLDFMLYNYKLYVWSLFFGLILGSLYVIIKRTKNTNSLKIIIFLIGIIFGLILSFSEPMIENRNLIFIFFCGFISICGITLPGLSGSFLLILLGNYELLLVDSVNNLYNFIISLISNESTVIIDYELINILLIFFLGSVLGLIILSNFLSFISKKYPLHLNHLIIGFVSGTLPVVWPWNKIDTEISQTDLLNFETIFAFLIILLSVVLIININHSVDKKNLRINR